MRAKGEVTDVTALPRWNDSDPELVPNEDHAQAEGREARFPYAPDINAKVVLWQGDICRLRVDAVCNPTNETLTDRSGAAGAIMAAAGPDLLTECSMAETCKTGEASVTKGCALPASFIIHSVGPRYNERYRTAAENALHSCYRNSMRLLKEEGLRTIAFPPLYAPRKGYPRVDAAHIALRTVRRFLEHYGDGIDVTVFVTESAADHSTYQRLLPLYFPRSVEEQVAAESKLPAYTGNKHGETVIANRQIRIAPLPGAGPGAGAEGVGPSADAGAATPAGEALEEGDSSRPSVAALYEAEAEAAALARDEDEDGEAGASRIGAAVGAGSTPVGADGFNAMHGDQDAARLRALEARRSALPVDKREEEEVNRLYARYLRRAKEEDLTDIAALNLLYQSGTDRVGRPILVYVARNLPTRDVDLDRVLLYMLLVLDPIVSTDYVMLYLHTDAGSENVPDLSWLRKVHSIFNRKYKKNLKQLFIVHTSTVLRMLLWVATPVVSSKVWEKVSYIDRVRDLYDYFDADQVLLPKFVYEYDREVNASAYGTSSE